MTIKKKVFAVFGPVFCAAVLIAIFFLAPFKLNLGSDKTLAAASTSMATNVLRGNSIKNKAMATKEYVPFFGSSELSRISPFHPSVLSEKYQRNYRPFLLGAPGTQSLTQALMIHSMGSELAGRKVVFIISPQWFVKRGVSQNYFNARYSELQAYQWVTGLKKISDGDRYLAQRLMQFPKVKEDEPLMKALTAIKDNRLPNTTTQHYLSWKMNLLSREDELFSKFGMISKQPIIERQVRKLPPAYNVKNLDQLAQKIGAQGTNTNQFQISNKFYRRNLAHRLDKLKGSQRNWDYRFSPEYSDLQLALEQLAQQKTEVLFIIPPVNERWSNFTGLSQEMLQEVAAKIKYQLTSQGFTNIADLTKEAATPYFMEDTIHLGWRGWLMVDTKVVPFLQQKKQPQTYQLSPTFYEKKWQQALPPGSKPAPAPAEVEVNVSF
ncbi:D-alanyl-lipoteichoic acid biosynthesis protein DltD [Enterococcus faecalis]